MNYYTIEKKQLQKFYENKINDNNLLSINMMSQAEFDLVSEYISYTKSNFEQIISNHSDSIDIIKKYIESNYFEEKIQKYIEPNTKKDVDKYIKNLSVSISLENIQIIAKTLSELNDNSYTIVNIKNKVAENIIFSYLITVQQYENFISIVSLANDTKQNTIIDINFDESIIKNIDGLNQLYSSYFNPNIESLVFHSTNSQEKIQFSLGAIAKQANEKEINQILTSRSTVVNFNDILADSIHNIEEINSVRDPFEVLINKIKTEKKRIKIEEFFPQFTNLLDNFIKNPDIYETHYDFIMEIKNYFILYESEQIEPLYIQYLKENFQQIDSNSTSVIILKILSPNSKFIGKEIVDKLSIDFFSNLLKNFNKVESAFLYLNFVSENNSTKKNLNFSSSDLLCNYNNNKKRSKKEMDKIIQEGYPAFLKDFHFAGEKCTNIISNIVDEISQQSVKIYQEFNQSPHFKNLQKDIYPLLSFKDKLNYNNYSCFKESTSNINGLNFTHIASIPLSLWYDKDILDKIMSVYHNGEEVKELLHYSHHKLISDYFSKAFYQVFTNVLIDESKEKKPFSLSSFNSFFRNPVYRYDLLDQMVEDNNINKAVNALIQQFNILKQDYSEKVSIISMFENFASPMMENVQKDNPEYFKTLKKGYFLFTTFFHKNRDISNTFLEAISSEPNFNPYESENKGIILNMYKQNNSSINKQSSTQIIDFILNKDNIKDIIQHHKDTNTISSCEGFNIKEGFKSDYFSKCFMTKTKMKSILNFEFDLVYLSPSLLKQLPETSYTNESGWTKAININCEHLRKVDNILIPKELTNNYSVFSGVFDHFLNLKAPLSNSDDKNLVLAQFPSYFFRKEDQIIKILNFISDNYKKQEHSNLISILSKIDTSLAEFLKKIGNRSTKESNLNPFATTLLKMESIAMEKNIFTHSKISSNKAKKF